MNKSGTKPSSITVNGTGSKKGPWFFTLAKDRLILTSKSGDEEYTFSRVDPDMKIKLLGEVAGRPVFIVYLPEHCVFEISRGDVETVREWLAPPEVVLFKTLIKPVRKWWPIPLGLGILQVFGALVDLLPPQDGSFNFVSAGQGALLLLIFVFLKVVVHPIVLPLAALWFASVAASLAYSITQGASSLWDIPLVLGLAAIAWFSFSGWSTYGRIRFARQVLAQQEDDVEQDASTPTDNAADGSI